MLAPEAGTARPTALCSPSRPTRLTRAFTGRPARGIVNRFMADHGDAAPAAYPEIHHLTCPLRAAARRRGDADVFNLWAGQAHELAQARPAAEIVQEMAAEARAGGTDQRGPTRSRYQCRPPLSNRLASSASSRRIGTSVNRVIVRCEPFWS